MCIPDSNWSYVSKSVSSVNPTGAGTGSGASFRIDRHGACEVRAPMSPASCVNLGVYSLCRDCDLVISGPNIGHNLGRKAVLSSGTVGAALEACLHGRRAIALSFPFNRWGEWDDPVSMDAALDVALHVTRHLWEAGWLPRSSLGARDDSDDPESSNPPSPSNAPPGAMPFFNVNVPMWVGPEAAAISRGGAGGTVATGFAHAHWEVTFADPGCGYTRLYRLDRGGGAQGGGEGGEGGADKKAGESAVWAPDGVRVFEAEHPALGGDVAAVKAGRVSISALAPALAAWPYFAGKQAGEGKDYGGNDKAIKPIE